MQHNYTSKLFFGYYPYKISLARSGEITEPDYHVGWNVHNASVFLNTNGIKHRTYNQVTHSGKRQKLVTVNSSLFLATKSDFDRCVVMWQQYIQSVTAPFKDEHVDVLKDNTEIIVRSSLLYKRFRYVVIFKRHWNEDISDLVNWVTDSFVTIPSAHATAKWHENGWQPRLYLANDSDLLLTKLTYGERIRRITVICTFDELEQNSSKP